MDPLTTVVVVTYNAAKTIGPLLEALSAAHEARGTRCVVVDNSSRDGTLDVVRGRFPWVEAVSSGGNLGFGRGCNLGFQRTQTRYVLFLNPDAVMQITALATLEQFMEGHPRVGICAPAIREGDQLQAAGLLATPTTVLRAATGLGRPYPKSRPIQPDDAPFRTSWVCGAAMMIRSDAFRALGGFDPRFFLYFEETDLLRRADEAGWEIWAVGQAVIEHEGAGAAKDTGQTLVGGCIAEHYFESRFYYLSKHHGRWAATATEAAEVAALLARSVLKRGLGRRDTRFRQRIAAPLFRGPKGLN
jgi:N-acetylglucosaminyl-diphospho-decaprenol L-rhamnosyltransferase